MKLKYVLPAVLMMAAAGILAFKAISRNHASPEDQIKKELAAKIMAARNHENSGVPTDSLDAKEEVTTLIMAQVLETLHYSPQKIDDKFSEEVFDKYLDLLDNEKKFFYQSDLDYLEKYKDQIDDEIMGRAPLDFYKAADSILSVRITAAKKLYPEVLAHPFNFNLNDSIELDAEKITFPAGEAGLKKQWETQLKYRTLTKLLDLKQSRKKAVDTAAIKKESDAQLESDARKAIKKSLDLYFDRMASHFDRDTRFSDFLNVIAGIMDPHTNYFSAKDSHYFDEQMSGTFYGIGALLSQSDYYVKIQSVVTGGPAWKQGQLKAGDLIMKVGEGNAEPVDMTGYTTEDAVKVIRGKKGSVVKLTVKHVDGTIEIVPIQRDEVKVEAIFAHSYVIDQEGKKIGFIVLPEFYFNPRGMTGPGSSAYDVRQEVEKLKAQNVDGIILDLRFNGGGSLGDAIDMAGIFIEKGPVVQVRSGNGEKRVLKDRDKDVVYSGPFAIMVNEYSASASEILSAAMQDYKRAVIIGSKTTFGKGTVQRKLDLENVLNPDQKKVFGDIGALKLTIQKFYRINGGSTQLKGVSSDIVLPDPYYDVKESKSDFAMPWDSIGPADYTLWSDPVDLSYLKPRSEERLRKSIPFSKIKENIKIIRKIGDETKISLNMKQYEAMQDANAHALKEVNKSDSLEIPLNMTDLSNNKSDTGEVDSMMITRNLELLKGYKKDPYLHEAVDVVKDMIMMPKVEKSKLTKTDNGQ